MHSGKGISFFASSTGGVNLLMPWLLVTFIFHQLLKQLNTRR
jgi:hypothetical protein